MHSRIIGLDLVESIREEDFLGNGFLDDNHDYVNKLNEDDTKESYDWFLNCLNYDIKHKAYIKDGFVYFPKEFKREYEKQILNRLRLFLSNSDETILSDFVFSSYKITEIISDKNGIYVSLKEKGNYETINQFIVLYLSDDEERKFKLSGALDYHS